MSGFIRFYLRGSPETPFLTDDASDEDAGVTLTGNWKDIASREAYTQEILAKLNHRCPKVGPTDPILKSNLNEAKALLAEAGGQLSHLLNDLTTEIEKEGLPRHQAKNTLAYSNFILAIKQLTPQIEKFLKEKK